MKQETHGEFKNEFYNFVLSSYKESTLNFDPKIVLIPLLSLFLLPQTHKSCTGSRAERITMHDRGSGTEGTISASQAIPA